MAIYHFNVSKVARSRGENSVRVAAYYACESFYNERTGQQFNYKNREPKPLCNGIILCKNAPSTYKDREILWNAVEKAERASDARVALIVEAALPAEYDVNVPEDFQYIQDMVKAYINDNFIRIGMCADWSIAQKKKNNTYFVALLTTRAFTENGSWAAKEMTRYKLDENGNKIPLIDPTTGKQKLRVRDGKGTGKEWVRESIKSNQFFTRERLLEWRKNWADTVNKALADKGLTDRVDHRSYKEQGVDKIPQIHIGRTAHEMADKGKTSDKMNVYDEIEEQKKEVEVWNNIARKTKEFADQIKKTDG